MQSSSLRGSGKPLAFPLLSMACSRSSITRPVTGKTISDRSVWRRMVPVFLGHRLSTLTGIWDRSFGI
jgi:hypothetical protein